MDVAAVMVWLALAVALNTAVTLILAVLLLRWALHPGGPDPGRGARPGETGSVRAGTERDVSSGSPGGTASSDPLAGAIEAFLGRSDGLFRSGGPGPGRTVAPGAARRQSRANGTRPVASPPATRTPATSTPAASPRAPMGPARSPELASRPPAGPALDRPLSEVTWATSRPSRFVPSGPRPTTEEGSMVAEAGPPELLTPGSNGSLPEADSRMPALGRRSGIRVSIALSARDGSEAGPGPAAVARLGRVIGAFIREHTRANDSVIALSGGRYSVVLPDTSLEGAAALMERLTESCDAWLAAERPPLRLEFGLADLPAYTVAGGPLTVRASGPERRRALSPQG